MNNIKTAYQHGIYDRKDGKSLNDNPFANQQDYYNFTDWIKGFKAR